jgi:dienelactone hydrolase
MSCPDCFKGTAQGGTPSGTITTLHGIPVYVASPPSTTTSTSPSTIIYIPDAFGYKFINNQLLADTYAARTGMRVLVPDVIPGEGMSTAVMPLMDAAFKPVAWWDILGQIKRIFTVLRVVYLGVPFMIKAKPNKVMPAIIDFARAVKKDLPSGGKLGVCGFCWGGNPSTALCVETASPTSNERLVDAQFCAHPSRVDIPTAIVDAIEKFKVPYSLAAAEKDMRLKMKDVEEMEVVLRQKVGNGDGENGCYYEIVRYPNCGHGFAVRAKPDDEVEMEGAGKACEQAVKWFTRWL